MQKIIIIGCPGSGKSTFARKLKQKLDYPVLHLDKIYHIDNNNHITREQLTEQVAQFANSYNRWIIDGNYISTLEQRIGLADTIIWLDIDSNICLANAIARTKQPRKNDMAAGFDYSKVSNQFLDFIKNFAQVARPQIENLMQKYAASKHFVVIKDYKQLKQFLLTLK